MAIVILILVAVIIYLVAFNKSKHELSHSIQVQGGMEFKYQKLLKNLRSQDPAYRILARTENTITIGNSFTSGYINFHLVETFDKLHVRFNLQNNILGHNKFDWDFSPNLDQDRMFEEILQGLALLDTRLHNKHF